MIFNVLGKKIRIKKVKDLMKTKEADGEFSSENWEIKIDQSLKSRALLHAVMHEAIHALCDRMGLENTSLSEDVEEILADKIPELFLDNLDIKLRCKKKRGE